jgi:dolichol-phosphate mannosyltransferase
MAYNEVESLQPFLNELARVTKELSCPWEIVIIDDGSRDGTSEIAQEYCARSPNCRLVQHAINMGLGGVYRTGFDQAIHSYVTFFPADGQFPAAIIPKFLDEMPDRDLVLGYLTSARPSALGHVLSMCEKILYRVLIGQMPRFQGVLMFRRSLLDEMTLVSEGRGWAVLLEFILRCAKAGKKIVSLPTSVRPRVSGHSKVTNFRTIRANISQLFILAYELRRSPD